MPRRRPLIWEEKQQRKTRQVATGNGQANARPVKLFPTRVQKPGGKVWLAEGVVEDVVPAKTDYPYFVWDVTKSC